MTDTAIQICLTRFVVLYPLPDTSARGVARKLLVNAGMFRATMEILVDNGSEFANDIVRELNFMLGTDMIFTTPYSYQENGIVE